MPWSRHRNFLIITNARGVPYEPEISQFKLILIKLVVYKLVQKSNRFLLTNLYCNDTDGNNKLLSRSRDQASCTRISACICD